MQSSASDAAPMAAMLSILFYNSDDNELGGAGTKTHDISGSSTIEDATKNAPSPTRQWELHKSKFLVGLIRCAGRRHALGATDSGCVTSRGIAAGRKNVEKARSYADWSCVGDDEATAKHKTSTSLASPRRPATMIEEYSAALRPMITLYTVFDELSREFVVNDDDENTEGASERLAARLEACYKADGVRELLRIADIGLGHDAICKYFEKGATS